MVFPDIHGSSGGIAPWRAIELKNARSMNFSAPRISGTAARMTRKTPADAQNQSGRAALLAAPRAARSPSFGRLFRVRPQDDGSDRHERDDEEAPLERDPGQQRHRPGDVGHERETDGP